MVIDIAIDVGVCADEQLRKDQSINQSKILTEPHTGKEKPIPALPQGVANPASRSDTGLGSCKPQL